MIRKKRTKRKKTIRKKRMRRKEWGCICISENEGKKSRFLPGDTTEFDRVGV